MAWLREENDIAWFSFASKHTVSFSANVNKDRKWWDHRGPPWAAAGSTSTLEPLRVCVANRFGKGQFLVVSAHRSQPH